MSYASDRWNAYVAQSYAPLQGVYAEWSIRWSFDGDRVSIAKIIHNTEAQIAALLVNGQLSPRRRKGPRDAQRQQEL